MIDKRIVVTSKEESGLNVQGVLNGSFQSEGDYILFATWLESIGLQVSMDVTLKGPVEGDDEVHEQTNK